MDLNRLFSGARSGDKIAEERLFRNLTVRFRLFVLYRIGDAREAEDIVQDTVMTISQKYKELTTTSNFTAWAYSILENNLRNFFRTQKYDREKLSRFAESGNVTVSSHRYPELKANYITVYVRFVTPTFDMRVCLICIIKDTQLRKSARN